MCALYDGFTDHLCVSGIVVDVTVKSVLIYEVDMLNSLSDYALQCFALAVN